MTLINEIYLFLKIKWIDTEYFMFDLWMVVHLFSGAFLGYFFKDWRWVFGILVAFEIIEFIAHVMLQRVLVKENFVNILWDLIFGMVGFFIIRYLLK